MHWIWKYIVNEQRAVFLSLSHMEVLGHVQNRTKFISNVHFQTWMLNTLSSHSHSTTKSFKTHHVSSNGFLPNRTVKTKQNSMPKRSDQAVMEARHLSHAANSVQSILLFDFISFVWFGFKKKLPNSSSSSSYSKQDAWSLSAALGRKRF